nr:unnamed protein product [Spirometra erinaceieuropaei]
MEWNAKVRAQSCHPPAPSFASGLLDYVLTAGPVLHRGRSLHRRRRASVSTPLDPTQLSPPRIDPDMPTLLRFFDRTGAQVRCQAVGNPQPTVRWFLLPSGLRTSRSGGPLPAAAAGGSDSTGSLDHASLDGGGGGSGPLGASDDAGVGGAEALELGFNAFAREVLNADDRLRELEATYDTASEERDLRAEDLYLLNRPPTSYPNQYVVGDGWLNFTATPRSSTLRMVFFCQAENTLGKVRSRKMVIHQVPVPDDNLRIRYSTFPIRPNQKAVIKCQPEQEIFNRFLRVKYWEVYRNASLIATVTHSADRYSVINSTKYPELHIRNVNEAELNDLGVRCVLQSIVDESQEIRPTETGRLQRLFMSFSYEEVHSVSTEVNVLAGSTVELPWAVEGAQDLPVHWSWRSKVRPEAPPVALYEEPVAASTGSGVEKEGTNQLMTFKRPWGSRYEFVQGKVGNLRLINVSVEDSGEYICESLVGRVARVVYTLKVRAPISVRIHPRQRVCDFGARVELECRVSGYPHQVIYWLHDAKLTSPLRHQIVRKTPAPDAPASAEVRERLIINSFSLEDIGVYQCVAESSLMDTATSPTAGTRGRIGELRESASSSSPSSLSSPSASSSSSSALSSSSSLLAATASILQSSISAGHSASDLVDNAQDSAHLIMGKMKPLLISQSPTVTEAHGTASQVLLSVSRAELKTTIECRFASNPLPSITWYRDDLKVPLDENNVITPQVQKDHSRPYSLITRLRLDLSKVPPWDELWRYGGEYRAVANNSHGFADCRTFVLLDTELRLRPVDSSKPAIAGRSHDLKCYFIGSGVPKLQWLRIKKDQRVERVPVDHRHQLLENNRVLRITEVNKEQDEADYRCIASLMDMTDNITISLKVSRAPRIQDLPEVQRVQGGRQSLTYSCAVQNYADKPWYAWWQFQPEGTNEVINLPPKSQPNPRAFQVAYAADTHQTKRWVLPDPLKGQVPSFVEDKPNSVVHVLIEPLDKQEHQGILTCKIMNAVGFEERSIRVTFIPEFEFDIRPPNKQDVILAQNISINCTARPSELIPMIVWKYSDESTGDLKELSSLTERTDGRIYQEENGTLVISQVEESDPRKFLCFLTPKESSTATPISVAVNLEVHVPARIEPLYDADQVRGSKFNLTCIVHGDANQLRAEWHYRASPKQAWRLIDQSCVLPASLQDESVFAPPFENVDFLTDPDACHNLAAGRFENGVVFRQISAFKPNGRGMERQLQFDSLKDVHMGEYMCRASNLYNLDSEGNRVEVEEKLRLTVISAPDPVKFVQNTSRTSATTISFAWQPPTHDGNKPIKMYSIRYYQPDAALDSPHQGRTSSHLDVPATQHQATLEGLRPYTKYHIVVTAVNEVGVSVENSLALTTQEAKPEGPVELLKASGVASDTISVTWRLPKPEHRNGNVDRYWICHQRVDDSNIQLADAAQLPWPTEPTSEEPSIMNVGGSSQVRCSLLHGQHDMELTGLPKFTTYAIRVIAINSKVPQAPPTNVTCSTQQHSITVSWDPPDFETVNGILTEYLVNYYIANDFGDETHSVNQVVKGQTTVTLAGLLANTNYTVQVAASNRKGRGPLSPKKSCFTTEAAPDAPEKVKAMPYNESCVMVSWSHPSRPQGVTRFYCIYAIRQTGGSHARLREKCVPPDFSKPYNYYLYCNLELHVPYNVSVLAKNRFDGRPASIAPVSPAIDSPISIISIGGTIVAQENMRVSMDCLVIGGFPSKWRSTNGIMDDVINLENGTLLIEAVKQHHSGQYVCEAREDSISYDLKVQDPPKPPVFHKLTPSLRNIQVEWLSPGSRRLDAPIRWFHLNWTNEHTGETGAVVLPADKRTYYLSNLTCATTVRFQIRAENQMGNSSLTDPISARTDGSAPLFVENAEMVPKHLRDRNTVTFNLSVFTPGHNCSPYAYHVRVWPAGEGNLDPAGTLLNINLTKQDLFSMANRYSRRCCFNVTSLRPGSYYRYHVVAENAAGKTPYMGYFWTRNTMGSVPIESTSNRLGRASFFSQPAIIVPLTVILVFLLVICVGILFYCRHRRFEAELQPTKPAVLASGGGRDFVGRPIGGGGAGGGDASMKKAPLRSGAHRGTLPPIPTNEKAQYTPGSAMMGTGVQRSSGLWGWLGTRPRVYDRGRSGAPLPQQPIEEDQRSNCSMDSTGSLNPYATYEAGGIKETVPQASVASVMPTAPTAVGVAGKVGRTMTRAHEAPVVPTLPGGSGATRSYQAFTEGHRGFPLSRQHSYMHQYHYPNLETAEEDGRLKPPRFIRVGSGRLTGPCGTRDAIRNRMIAQNALLDPPVQQPYVNNTLEEEDDENMDFADPSRHHPMGRRVNSLESLQQIFRQGAMFGGAHTTYHRGYASGARRATAGGPLPHGAKLPVPPGFLEPSTAHIGGPGSKSMVLDPMAAAYRGSVLSSTTVSSNQDELMQAYEYGRKQAQAQARALMALPSHAAADTFDGGGGAAAAAAAAVFHSKAAGKEGGAAFFSAGGPPGPSVGPAGGGVRVCEVVDASGGSGSSETTDPGICQFTQQPPRPEEALLAAASSANGNLEVVATKGRPPAAVGRTRVMLETARDAGPTVLPPAFLQRQLSECPSEMTDTYASVDYTAAGYTTSAAPPLMTVSGRSRGPAGAGPLLFAATRQKLSLPPESRLDFPELENESGVGRPVYRRQSSQHSYYYPSVTTTALAVVPKPAEGGGYYNSKPCAPAMIRAPPEAYQSRGPISRQPSASAAAAATQPRAFHRTKPLKVNPRQLAEARGNPRLLDSTSTGYGSASRRDTSPDDLQQLSSSSYAVAPSGRSQRAISSGLTTGPVEATEDEENVYTSEFVLV